MDKTSRKNSASTFSFEKLTERKKVLKRVKLGIKTSASHETDKFFIVGEWTKLSVGWGEERWNY